MASRPPVHYSSLKNSSLKNSSLKNSSLNNSSLKTLSLNDSSLKTLSLNDSSLKNSSLNDSSLKNSSLNDSSLKNSSLNDSSLNNLSLKNKPPREGTPNADEAQRDRKPVPRPRPAGDNLQKVEIQQLCRRFQATGISQKQFGLPIVDPDFPFDIESVGLAVTLPPAYPQAAFPAFRVTNANIPASLVQKIETQLARAVRTLPGELSIRPMLRYLENNLESMLIDAPLSIKFVAPTAIRPVSPATSPASPASPAASPPVNSRFSEPDIFSLQPANLGAMGGAVEFQTETLALQGVGILLLVGPTILFRCARCSCTTAVADIRPSVDRLFACQKCAKQAQARFTLEPLYGRTRRLGFLQCRGTVPADLLPSTFQAVCSQCVPEDGAASAIRVAKVRIGEKVAFACRNCHSPCSFAIGPVRWSVVPSAIPATSVSKKLASQKLPTKVGEPLPNCGACSHYKKSFRWLRFPCCGKAYPCDVCHDDSAGHKAEWATRQICGKCSREFATSAKECVCGATPADPRRTAHWEGGKGTRDQIAMSRKDKKKYRSARQPSNK